MRPEKITITDWEKECLNHGAFELGEAQLMKRRIFRELGISSKVVKCNLCGSFHVYRVKK